MGTVLTSYGDAGYGHEGYAAQVLEDGTITGVYSSQTRARMVGQVVAACGCGWAGITRYPCPEPFDEQAEELALAEWEQAHARPVLEEHRRGRAARLARLLGDLAERHRADLTTAADGPGRLELLDRTLRALASATELAQELRDEAEAERGADR